MWHGPGTDVKYYPNDGDMLHRLNLGPTIHDVSTNLEKMQISGIQMTLGVTQQHNSTIRKVTTVSISDSDIDIDDNEPCDIKLPISGYS